MSSSQERQVISLTGVEPDSRASVQNWIQNTAHCGNRHPDDHDKQTARIAYLLLLGVDVPAQPWFLHSDSTMLPTAALCAKMSTLLNKRSKAAERGKALEPLADALTSRRPLAALGRVLVPASNLLQEAVGPTSAMLIFYLYGGDMRAYAATQVLSTLTPALGRFGINLMEDEVKNAVGTGEVASDIAHQVDLSDGLSVAQLAERRQLLQSLRDTDVAVYKMQDAEPDAALLKAQTSLPITATQYMKNWQAAGGEILKAYHALSRGPGVDTTASISQFRKELVHSQISSPFFVASMVFDSLGRLRTDADIVRAFCHNYEQAGRVIGEAADAMQKSSTRGGLADLLQSGVSYLRRGRPRGRSSSPRRVPSRSPSPAERYKTATEEEEAEAPQPHVGA